MKTNRIAFRLIVAVLLFASLPCRAQDPAFDDFSDADDEGVLRKQPSFWHRPKQDAPAPQLAYADSLRTDGRLRKAARQYNALVHAWHDTPEAVKAQLAYATCLESRGKYDKAFNAFQYLVDFYTGQFDYTTVLDHQFRIANEVMNRRYGGFLLLPGFKSPERALPLFKKISENAPTWQRAPDVQFLIASIHEENKKYEEAVHAYDVVRQRWPHHELAAVAAFGGARCLVRLADKNERDEVACQRALEAVAGFLRDYPDDPNAEQMRVERERLSRRFASLYYDRAAYYDKIAKRPESALIAYTDFLRRFPYAEQAEAVNARVQELQRLIPSEKDSK